MLSKIHILLFILWLSHVGLVAQNGQDPPGLQLAGSWLENVIMPDGKTLYPGSICGNYTNWLLSNDHTWKLIVNDYGRPNIISPDLARWEYNSVEHALTLTANDAKPLYYKIVKQYDDILVLQRIILPEGIVDPMLITLTKQKKN